QRRKQAGSRPGRAGQSQSAAQGAGDYCHFLADLGCLFLRDADPGVLDPGIDTHQRTFMSSYCQIAPGHEWHGPYHQHHYGVPIADDDQLFERLILEINQAGLSWLTILKRQEAFRKAFRGFEVERVARMSARDVERLMQDASIIRNRMKIEATVENARRIRVLQREQGSLAGWIAAHHPLTKAEWVKIGRAHV